MNINLVDICVGLNWGDEAKGKIVSQLAKSQKYNYVCRWGGGDNAGHTVYVNNIKYVTHLIPCGIFYNIPSIIGPGCVVNIDSFNKEIEYLKKNNFNTDLVKISPKAHIITNKHLEKDKKNFKNNCSTSKGISPCYTDKYSRTGIQAIDIYSLRNYIWDETLEGNILCEGAQGFWLDIDHGNYPYVTSSNTLPYAACSLGFPTNLIKNIYGASKIYDTRVGFDPLFPESLLDNSELQSISKYGNEIGATTGRQRKVNWLNVDKLIKSINISGTTHVIISKTDILFDLKLFKIIHENKTVTFNTLKEMEAYILNIIMKECRFVKKILFSNNVETVNNLI